jgi:hypothetical protein
MSYSRGDGEYIPPADAIPTPRKKQKISKSYNKKIPNFLSQHKDDILKYKFDLKMSNPEVAKSLCNKLNLKEGAIKGKQIANWLDYQVKTKKIKPPSVSPKNNNLAANPNDCII